MKKTYLALLAALAFILCVPTNARANMAAPADPDIGSSITFEKNDAISVLSEVLDIAVHGAQADITATYQMENTTDTEVSTRTMFLAPNIEDSGVRVVVNGADTAFTAESYKLSYDTEIATEEWCFAILSEARSDAGDADDDAQTVDTVTFNLNFAPREAYHVIVSYTYRLGGYPEYTFNAKRGEIAYYLAPAAMWKDFSNLTINLYLDEDMPVISESNLAFEKVGERTYQYTSDTLPEENLHIEIDENWFQNIGSTLRSPYFRMNLLAFAPFALGLLLTAGVIVFVVRRVRRKAHSY